MELITDEDGEAAPRLNDVQLTPEQARAHHATLLVQVMRMLRAGVVHGTCRSSTSCSGPTVR